MPKGIPLTQPEIDLRRHEIAQAAVPLFLKAGFSETSMSDIARAAGAGKSTLYDYFAGKDEILVHILHESIEEMLRRAGAVLKEDGNARDHLVRVMQAHLGFLLENKALFLKISMEAQRLSKASQQAVQLERYRYQDLLQNLVEKGITEGSFRPANPTMVTKTLLALMTPVVYTSRPAGTPEEMLAMGLDIVLNGLSPQPPSR